MSPAPQACWRLQVHLVNGGMGLVGKTAGRRLLYTGLWTLTSARSCIHLQEAQVTVECAIPQKFHRSVMGPKGSRIQQITRDYNVQIKFPDREENPGGST